MRKPHPPGCRRRRSNGVRRLPRAGANSESRSAEARSSEHSLAPRSSHFATVPPPARASDAATSLVDGRCGRENRDMDSIENPDDLQRAFLEENLAAIAEVARAGYAREGRGAVFAFEDNIVSAVLGDAPSV